MIANMFILRYLENLGGYHSIFEVLHLIILIREKLHTFLYPKCG